MFGELDEGRSLSGGKVDSGLVEIMKKDVGSLCLFWRERFGHGWGLERDVEGLTRGGFSSD